MAANKEYMNKYMRKYRAEHPAYRARQREYNKFWRGVKLATDPAYALRDRLIRKEANQRWNASNPEAFKTHQKAWREKNKEKLAGYVRSWRKKNRAKANAYQRKYQRARRKAEGLARGARVNALLRKGRQNV